MTSASTPSPLRSRSGDDNLVLDGHIPVVQIIRVWGRHMFAFLAFFCFFCQRQVVDTVIHYTVIVVEVLIALVPHNAIFARRWNEK